jgi:hypothetical protein
MATRKQEIVVAAIGAAVTTIAVAVVKLAWAVEPATFIAGVGTGGVVYVILKNKELAALRRR